MSKTTGRKISIITTVSLVVIFLTSCAAPTRLRLHPEFVNNPGSVKSITMLPLDCQVRYLDLSDENKNHPQRENEIDSLLTPLIPKIIASQKYEVEQLSFSADSLDSTAFLNWVYEMRASHAASMPLMYPKPNIPMEKVLDYPGQISPEIVGRYAGHETDAFLLVRYSGFKRSTGAMAAGLGGGIVLGVLTGYAVIPFPEGGIMMAALVDGRSGNILWHNVANLEDYSLDKLVETLFSSFPDCNESLSQYISGGEEIKHPFKVEDFELADNQILLTGEDYILMNDGSAYSGEIIKVSKRNCVMKNRRTVYIINRKKIKTVTMNGAEVTASDLASLDFPKVNYNNFDEKVEIY